MSTTSPENRHTPALPQLVISRLLSEARKVLANPKHHTKATRATMRTALEHFGNRSDQRLARDYGKRNARRGH